MLADDDSLLAGDELVLLNGPVPLCILLLGLLQRVLVVQFLAVGDQAGLVAVGAQHHAIVDVLGCRDVGTLALAG